MLRVLQLPCAAGMIEGKLAVPGGERTPQAVLGQS